QLRGKKYMNISKMTKKELIQHAKRHGIKGYSRKTKIELMKMLGGDPSGMCRICGRTLSNPKSMEKGIGPICERKHSRKIDVSQTQERGKQEKNQYPTLVDYTKQAKLYISRWKIDKKCMCGKPVQNGWVNHYEHESGWYVRDYKKKQWLYFECPKCGNQYSFAHAGVRRPYGNNWKK
ncbi:MAG: DUF6011 domain-containing protein, partial [bacterium]